MAHVVGQSRYQVTLYPETLDDVIAADSAVRVIDGFVDSLDLAELGFSHVEAEATGRPPYDPRDLLKLYIYGYLNQMRSSRRLEREAQRNVEVFWLINRLTPVFKTIADFRKDHPEAIVGVCRAFIKFCRGQSVFGGEVLAIDGSKIAAAASRKQVITKKKLAERDAAIERKIAEYLTAMDEADAEETPLEPTKADVAAALAALKAQRAALQQQAKQLVQEGLKQKVLGEPEAKLMRTPRGHQVAYNAQIAVDAQHALIVAFDLTNESNDLQQLHPMARQGKAAVGADQVSVVADTGYANGAHGKQCEQDGITAIVPRAERVNPKGKQYFSRDQFSYDRENDSWNCPAGEILHLFKTSRTKQKKEYRTQACPSCPLKSQCTKAARRIIVRGFHDDDREAMHQRAMADPSWMKLRRQVAEHPFGTVKWLMGIPRFLLRGLRKAKAELALSITGYNIKRMIAIKGVPALLQALRPRPA
ncbi:IS1182 family transposase [Bradyrhizobium sp. USDA 4454]